MTARRAPAVVVAAFALSVALSPVVARSEGPPTWAVSLEGNLAFLGQIVSSESGLGAFAYRGAVGYTHRRAEIFVSAEHGFWRAERTSPRLSVQTLDVGLGFGVTYFGDRARTELAAGPSILLTRAQLDAPGTTGFFVDARPVGFRIRIGGRLRLTIYPLTFAFVAPVTEGIPLVYISYRTALVCGLEL